MILMLKKDEPRSIDRSGQQSNSPGWFYMGNLENLVWFRVLTGR